MKEINMRCKFKVQSITRQISTVTSLNPDGSVATDTQGKAVHEQGETWSVKMSPVYANGDPKHENSVFWAYSPGGSFELTTVNKSAVEKLQLNGEYYITPAFHSPK